MVNNWHDYFYYDESSPSCLKWKIRKTKAGNNVGYCDRQGYYNTTLHGKKYKVHRIVYEIHKGTKIDKSLEIDHIDGNPSNNIVSNLRVVDGSMNRKNQKLCSRNTSGVIGVSLMAKMGCPINWVAYWYDMHKKPKSKSFSINKYGNNEAFKLACEYREQMIRELNAQGAGYTERHGKEI